MLGPDLEKMQHILGKCWGAFGRQRGRTGSQCVTVVALSIGTGSRTWCWRSGMEQVREFYGEQAYEKMRRAVEKADQEKARQVERARQAGEDPRSFRRARGRSAVGRNGGGRSGTLAPAADPGLVSSEECGPNATRGLAKLARLDGVNAGGFRLGLQDAPEGPQCGGGPDVARADEGRMSQHRFKGTAFAYGSQSW